MSNEHEFASLAGVELIGKAERQMGTLQTAAKPFVTALLALDSSEQGDAARAFFVAARGSYVSAKMTGAKEKATRMGRGWNNLRAAIAYHLGQEGLVANWPNWSTGVGDCQILSKEEHKGKKEEEKAAREAADQEALAANLQQQTMEKLGALKELGPDDVRKEIEAMLKAWGGDIAAVIIPLNNHYVLSPEINAGLAKKAA